MSELARSKSSGIVLSTERASPRSILSGISKLNTQSDARGIEGSVIVAIARAQEYQGVRACFACLDDAVFAELSVGGRSMERRGAGWGGMVWSGGMERMDLDYVPVIAREIC